MPSPPEIGWKEKLALWVIWNFLKGKGVKVNFKYYGVADWLKLVANVAAAGGAGFAAGGYAGLAVGMITALATVLQTPPGKISFPK